MVALCLVGCASPDAGDVPPADSGQGVAEEEGLTPEEFDSANRACLEEAGWTLSRDEYGQLSVDLQAGQAEDYERAANQCAAQLQVDAKYLEPLDDGQREVIYVHYEENVIPCLESLGYAPAALPSLEVFVSTMDSEDAYQVISPQVYRDIAEDVAAGRWETPDDVIRGQCDVVPPDNTLQP